MKSRAFRLDTGALCFLVIESYLYAYPFIPLTGISIFRQSSEKYSANHRKTVVKFIIIAYNRGNTEEDAKSLKSMAIKIDTDRMNAPAF